MSDTLERDTNDNLDDKLNPANRPHNQPGSPDMSEFEKEFDPDRQPGTRDMSEFEDGLNPAGGTSAAGADMSEFENEFNPQSPIVGNNLRGREDRASRKSASSAELKNEEESANKENSVNYTGSEEAGNSKVKTTVNRRFWNRKRAAIAGSVAGIGVGGGLLGLSFLSGPLQLFHLGETLGHSWTKQQSDTETSGSHWFRDLRALKNKDIRYTNAGLIGTGWATGFLSDLANAGVEFSGNDLRGNPTKVVIDQEKLAASNEEIKNMSPEELTGWLNDKLGRSTESGFKVVDGKQTLDIAGGRSQDTAALLKSSRSLVGETGLVPWTKARALKKFWNLGSLFHPLSRAVENKIQEKVSARKAANENETAAEEEVLADNTTETTVTPSETEGVAEYDKTKAITEEPEKKAASAVGVVGPVWVTACLLKGAGEGIVKVNRDLTVLPAAKEATSIIGIVGNIKAGGDDVTPGQIGGVVSNLTNNAGQSVESGGALQVLSGDTKAKSDGSVSNDLPGDVKGAFENDGLGQKLTSAGSNLLGWLGLNSISKGVSIATLGTVDLDPCGLAAGAIVIGGSLAGQTAAIATDEDGGASSAILWLAGRALEEAVKGAVGAVILGRVTNVVVKSATAPTMEELFKKVGPVFSGPLGGDLLAYGSRAAANLSSMANGGIDLLNNASTLLGSAGEEQQSNFEHQSFISRVADITENQSLLGHLSMDISPSFATNVTSFSSGMLTIPHMLSSTFGSLFHSTASADDSSSSWTGNYNWGFSQFGIPDSLMNDTTYNDPLQNSQSLGQWLSQNCVDKDGNIGPSNGPCGGDEGYTNRIATCFGNDLTYTDSVWDVTSKNNVDIDSNTQEYTDAHCGDMSDTIWKRIIMFVNDTHTLKAMDCVGGSDSTSSQSCTDEGVSGQDTSTDATPPTTTSTNPTIVLDPGHSPATNGKVGETGHTDPISGLNDGDYENDPEMQDVWDVANLVKNKLSTDGYNVLLTKTSEDQKVYQAQRSDVANKANAALALSIHDNAGSGGCSFSSGSQSTVYYQSVGTYRTNPGGSNKVTFTDQGVANTSKNYAQIFQKDRSSVEGINIKLQGTVGYNLGARGTGFDPGNIWLVQLLSKEPWIYNESCGNSAGQNGLNQTDKQKYADGLIKSIEEAVPLGSGK